jgi:hypothetical protein
LKRAEAGSRKAKGGVKPMLSMSIAIPGIIVLILIILVIVFLVRR